MWIVYSYLICGVTVVLSINWFKYDVAIKELMPRIMMTEDVKGFQVVLTNPDEGTDVDFFAKIANPYALPTQPDAYFGKFMRVNVTHIVFTCKSDYVEFYKQELLYAFLVARVGAREGIRTILYPINVLIL